jgi:hypothetical protein
MRYYAEERCWTSYSEVKLGWTLRFVSLKNYFFLFVKTRQNSNLKVFHKLILHTGVAYIIIQTKTVLFGERFKTKELTLTHNN